MLGWNIEKILKTKLICDWLKKKKRKKYCKVICRVDVVVLNPDLPFELVRPDDLVVERSVVFVEPVQSEQSGFVRVEEAVTYLTWREADDDGLGTYDVFV